MAATTMDWKKLLVEDRLKSFCKPEDGRSAFQKDIDRITFSGAFRRLGRKTQVHPLNDNDHIHTRLSHSLEVACVGRSLGVMVGAFLEGKNELPLSINPQHVGEIVQAACLAHDIGNPPFGHAGEEVIKKWFLEAFNDANVLKDEVRNKEIVKNFTLFDGNAMAFRVVTHSEYHTGDGGMRLTYPTLGAMLKYPWSAHHAGKKNKFSCLHSEYMHLTDVADKLGLIRIERNDPEKKAKYARHPLAYLVEAADDICYRILDLEDAVELGLLPHNELEKFKSVIGKVDAGDEEVLAAGSGRAKNALIRGKLMEQLIKDIHAEFCGNYDKIMEGTYQGSLLDNSKSDVCSMLIDAYRIVVKDVYSSRRKTLLEIGAFSTIGNLLQTFVEAAKQICKKDEAEWSFKTKRILDLLGSNLKSDLTGSGRDTMQLALVLILDYVSGMTDHYATELNRKILGFGS